ncbi:TetR/AcrR family transcriptional regulator [Bifidobacterium amazonense]|uniref:TetR/AcrR family transcriptional regulator n=1 Tax=Bifidobacterium amazonense TaxID=2809027 RepID=A0ABS9VYA1_9BIFI|nr:TetR/AcrR family transcriptional regulator [Bifidobacterium amazonense]MCH9277090.1 TetR/AcrR family transcriptional regulator [Bifidobacterium amazonense]
MARNAHPEVTERRILAAAKKLFAEQGYEKTTIQDIVDELGDLSKGAIYHHFKSKEAMLERLNDDDWAAYQQLHEQMDSRNDLTGLEKIRLLFSTSMDSTEHLDLARDTMPLLDDPATLAANLQFWSTKLPTFLRTFIDEGIRDGSLPTEYPAEVAQLLALLCNYWLMPHFYPATRAEMEHRIRCLRTMLDAVGAPVFDDELERRVLDGMMRIAAVRQ